MTPKQWLALLCFYISYMLFGAGVFYYIESNKELEERAQHLKDRIKVNELLVKFASPQDENIQNEVLRRVSNYCGRPVTNYTLDEYPEDYKRTFYHSFWFTFIVCSTLGYGSNSPHDERAQVFLIFYALIGLPVNGFVLAYLGDFFSKAFIRMYKRYKGQQYASTQNYAVVKKVGLVSRIIMLLIPGIAIFIFLPACVFTYFEDWPYVTSVYYSFITLTTIGFGDYVPTFQDGQARKFGIYFTFYQIFIVLWNVIGMGYFVMIIGFIAKGMQSKKIARIEHQLAVNIKATQSKIWTGVTKDLGFLRRILNEVNLMKFKPVYTDSTEKIAFSSLPRSLSCPELTMYREEKPIISPKRTFSENYGPKLDSSTMTSTITLHRVQSEGDLSRIDKKKTFQTMEGSSLLQTQNALTSILTALGSIQLASDDHLSDSDYSEDIRFDPPRRPRAFSDFYVTHQKSFNEINELTWNGNDDHQIQEYLRKRSKKFSIASIFATKSESSNHSETNRQMEDFNSSFMSKINPFKARVMGQENKRNSVTYLDPQTYLNKTAKGRESGFSLSHASTEHMELLEKTTIADLIRAVEDVQSKPNVESQTPLMSDFRGSLRSRTSPSVSPNLQVPSNGTRRGSLRPVPVYTTIFSSENLSRQNDSTMLVQESNSSGKNVPMTAPLSSLSSQILRRTFSLRPSPLATLSHSTSNIQALPETPIITVQPPNVTTMNELWMAETKITDRSINVLKNRSRHKRADSK